MATPTAFVTGSTGLLGNNLVRLLSQRGWKVKALARSRAKAEKQLAGIAGVEIVVGDMTDVASFAPALAGSDVLFHTAAHFRDSYKGGDRWPMLHKINVEGTRQLLEAAYVAGVRRMVHTSSIAVLDGPRGATMNETMARKLPEKDPYYRSKVMSDQEVFAFLDAHPDFHATFVLPGWMHGPGDVGPTQAGQTVMDFVNRKLPGIVPATFSFVDARDVALAQIISATQNPSPTHSPIHRASTKPGDPLVLQTTSLQIGQAMTHVGPVADLKPLGRGDHAQLRVLPLPGVLGVAKDSRTLRMSFAR